MEKARLFQRRGELQIFFAILYFVDSHRNGVGPTDIMYEVEMSYKQKNKYLSYLVAKKFLEFNGLNRKQFYKITPQGQKLLNLLAETMKTLGLKK